MGSAARMVITRINCSVNVPSSFPTRIASLLSKYWIVAKKTPATPTVTAKMHVVIPVLKIAAIMISPTLPTLGSTIAVLNLKTLLKYAPAKLFLVFLPKNVTHLRFQIAVIIWKTKQYRSRFFVVKTLSLVMILCVNVKWVSLNRNVKRIAAKTVQSASVLIWMWSWKSIPPWLVFLMRV